MIKILGISGSLRAKSYNSALLHAAQAIVGNRAQFEIATLHGIPLYDGDLEDREGLPAAVADLKTRIIASDGLLLATPEYNNGMPGVFKNAIDWLSRPPADTAAVFAQRPVAVIGASPGAFGSVLAQAGWLPVLRALGVQHYSGARLMVSKAHQAFDDKGALNEPSALKQLQGFLQGYLAFVEQQSSLKRK